MKKLLILIFSILSTVFIASFELNASSDEIIGYTLNSEREEGFLYKSDLHLPSKNYTESFMNFDENIQNQFKENNNRIIIEDDDRRELYDYEYTIAPYRSICKIVISFNEEPGISHQGTGFLVGPHTILTACHVVYDINSLHDYGFFDTISITFGSHIDSYTEQIVNPYGEITTYSLVTCGNYKNTLLRGDDWALIDLNTEIGLTLGYFGTTTVLSEGSGLYLAGYSNDHYGNMAVSYGEVYNLDNTTFDHDCDLESGASGSPIIRTFYDYVCGIESGHTSTLNSACRITSNLVSLIEDRIEDDD